jgi:hypothetical protein
MAQRKIDDKKEALISEYSNRISLDLASGILMDSAFINFMSFSASCIM